MIEIVTLVLRLIMFIAEMTREAKQEKAGYTKAVQDALDQAHRDLAMADAERAQADATYSQDPTDSAFDQEFKR